MYDTKASINFAELNLLYTISSFVTRLLPQLRPIPLLVYPDT